MKSVNSIIYTLFKAITLAVLSSLLVYYFDVARFLSFIPKERTFVISNSIYLALLVGVFSSLEELYTRFSLSYKIIFSPDIEKRTEKDTAIIVLNDTIGYANFYVDLVVNGREDQLNKSQINIYFPQSITVQVDAKHKGYVKVDSNTKVCKIDISKLTNNKSKQQTELTPKIKFSILKKENFIGTDKILNAEVVFELFFFRYFFSEIKSNQLRIKIKG
ncbi:hypothetical protein [Paenibacillus campi]|uniref:hypothetical protein n=1 Tax=Paenibacillus campi TaxID=3106031 RepID=UPI002AFECF18|nr:hypothetical protein [Paenibacillus sp. SGZ-1014]